MLSQCWEVDSPAHLWECVFVPTKFMFADVERTFSDVKHMFTDGKHTFTVGKHKKSRDVMQRQPPYCSFSFGHM